MAIYKCNHLKLYQEIVVSLGIHTMLKLERERNVKYSAIIITTSIKTRMSLAISVVMTSHNKPIPRGKKGIGCKVRKVIPICHNFDTMSSAHNGLTFKRNVYLIAVN